MKKLLLILNLLLSASFLSTAQKQVTLVPFSFKYLDPQDIENCGDSRLFIVQRNGMIFICDSLGNKRDTPFLNIRRKIQSGGEKGLLGLAFDPGYSRNGFFYVHFTNKLGHAQISRFRVSSTNPNIADSTYEKLIFENPNHDAASHNGGNIRFGPDRYLYIAFGDGGGSEGPGAAQNTLLPLGKMLRIDVHHGNPYSIPADNPFVNDPDYLPEIWAIGFRNPWRWSFDAVTGDLRIADVGEATWEEVDFQAAGDKGGENYGWGCYEGKQKFDTSSSCPGRKHFTFPYYVYKHVDTAGGACAIIGGFVYRGHYTYLYGKYIFGDYCNSTITALYQDSGFTKTKVLANAPDFSVTSFGEDYHHEMYVTNYVDGGIYRLTVTAGPQPVSVEKQLEANLLAVAPNPSNGNFNIGFKSSKMQQVNIRIQNIMGQQFYNGVKALHAGMNTWQMSTRVPKGDYYITITETSGTSVSQKIRIE